jgi:ribonuclease R
VDVTIQKVDVLRHQIDLAVLLPEGYEEYTPDGAESMNDEAAETED